jgi:Holliday junction resolvasome RuvABC endonuclease subunit
MIIAGVDSSFASPAIVWAKLDKNFDLYNMGYIAFTSVKKFANDNIFYYDKKRDDNNNIIDRYLFFTDVINNKLLNTYKVEYVGIEDYAYSAPGQITKLAETVGAIKVLFYNNDIKIRLYEIGNIKRFATSKGSSDKFVMEDFYTNLPIHEKIDLNFLPRVSEKKAGNPKDNIIDAYFIMKFLQTELKVRNGITLMQDLPQHQIACFNNVTKYNPLNLPVRPFIYKEKDKK